MMKLRWDPIAKEQITEILDFYKTRYGLRTARKIWQAYFLSINLQDLN